MNKAMSVTGKGTLMIAMLLISPLSLSAPADGHVDPGEGSLEEIAKSAQKWCGLADATTGAVSVSQVGAQS